MTGQPNSNARGIQKGKLTGSGRVPDEVQIGSSSALPFTGVDIEGARRQLLDLLSAWSEDRWAAGWMSGIDQEAHEAGGVWEVAGRVIGWPLGYRADEGWVTWDEATLHYDAKRRGRVLG